MKTLEEILQMLGSKKPFREKPIEYDDGTKDWLTKSGNEAYEKLTEIIYAVGEICGCDVEDIIETLDCIADKEV